jgi:mannosidase alpha-like ER degradation enhancer 1
MTIRALGSLLSTYQYLDRLPDSPKDQARALTGIKQKKVDLKKYKGRILEMAEDLGRRMLPAFETKTGLPYARVNLRHGVETGETTDTCKSGLRSLVKMANIPRCSRRRQSGVGIHCPLQIDWRSAI